MKALFQMSDRAYDITKQVALYWLPAAGTFYFTIGGIWGLPYGEEVVGTITALVLLLSVILGVSKSGYEPTYDGTITVDEPAQDLQTLHIDTTADEIRAKDTIILKVETPDSQH